MPKSKTSRVWVTPLFRFRVLTNQRTEIFRNSNLITADFISDMVATSEKLNKSSSRTLLFASLYLAVLYIAYSGSGISIKILGIEFSDIPKLLEISIALFSFSLFYVGVQLLRQEILRQSIDSMIGSLLPNDEISQALLRYRSGPGFDFIGPFKASFLIGKTETIKPVGFTKLFNFIAYTISLITILLVYLIPMLFLLAYAVPSMVTSIPNIVIGGVAWMSSVFLLIVFVSMMVKFPYDETVIEKPNDVENNS